MGSVASGPRRTIVPSSRGGQLLVEAGSLSQIGRYLGVRHSTVRRWIDGTIPLTVERAAEIEAAYKIPVNSWGKPPKEEQSK
jgi:transcriptional regulator with XRE-family HTH domain